MRENRYLMDRARKRNPYGSRGGYVRDYRNDYRNDYSDYRSDYRNDYRNDYESENGRYQEDLKHWADKLKRRDRFNVGYDELINQAKQMGISFGDFSEMEFYVVYLMMLSDHPKRSNYQDYMFLAKEWLEDDDIAVSPSEKLCIYYYKIVKGEE